MATSGARFEGPLPGAALLAAAEEAARRATIEIGARAVSMVKESLLFDTDSRGFQGRADTGQAHDAVSCSAPERTDAGFRTVTGIGPPRDEISGVLEKGRRAGKRPPPSSALEPWVRRELRDEIAGQMKGARVSPKARARVVRRTAIAQRKMKNGVWTAAEGLAFIRGQKAQVTGVKKASLDSRIRSVAFLVARSIGRKGTPGLHMFKKAADALRGGLAADILRSAWHRTLAQARGKGGA